MSPRPRNFSLLQISSSSRKCANVRATNLNLNELVCIWNKEKALLIKTKAVCPQDDGFVCEIYQTGFCKQRI